MSLTVSVTTEVPVKFLVAEMQVRYWEDGIVNGDRDDEDSPTMPFASGEMWRIIVDLETGKILHWPTGVTAETHFKVCDAGVYRLLKEDGTIVKEVECYVPTMLAPNGGGFGDYVILKIDGTGQIDGWTPDLSYFEERDY